MPRPALALPSPATGRSWFVLVRVREAPGLPLGHALRKPAVPVCLNDLTSCTPFETNPPSPRRVGLLYCPAKLQVPFLSNPRYPESSWQHPMGSGLCHCWPLVNSARVPTWLPQLITDSEPTWMFFASACTEQARPGNTTWPANCLRNTGTLSASATWLARPIPTPRPQAGGFSRPMTTTQFSQTLSNHKER